MNYIGRVSVLLFLTCTPFFVHAEYIHTFNVDIGLSPDSSFVVTEAIGYDFEDSKHHGIFREIPTTHPQDEGSFLRKRYMDIEVLNVLLDGGPVPYEITDRKDTFYLRIGDPNVTIDGFHTYTVVYKVTGGLLYFENGGAELYWNVIGTDWEIPIVSASATLHAMPELFAEGRACYAGKEGEIDSCKEIRTGEGSITFSQNLIHPDEGFTIAQSINRNKVGHVVLERTQVLLFWVGGLLFWLLALGIFVYQYRTAEKTGKSIIAQYEPYEDFKPMYTGLLFDGRLDARDITAGIVYLAEQGFIKIRKIESKVMFFFKVDDHEITLLKPVALAETYFLREVLKLIFGDEAETETKVTLGSLKNDIGRQKENRVTLGALRKATEKDLQEQGFFQVILPTHLLVGAGVVIAFLIFVIFQFVSFLSEGIIVLFVGIVLSVAILAFMYRRRTRKGYEALDHLKGFKLFLSMTDKERFDFHNAPEKNPQQFLEYLPYAIAFGVEEKWAEVFKDITIPAQEWYDSGTGAATFSSSNLTTSLGAFSTAFASSSGASSSGGAGGGGSVGGGGGGGGGGSW